MQTVVRYREHRANKCDDVKSPSCLCCTQTQTKTHSNPDARYCHGNSVICISFGKEIVVDGGPFALLNI